MFGKTAHNGKGKISELEEEVECCVCLLWMWHCTPKLSAAVAVSIQLQRLNLLYRVGRTHKVPSVTKDINVVSGCYEERRFLHW